MRVLIAEDERIIALGLSSLVRRLGHEVSGTVPSGESCVASVERDRPDVVFMDIRMEGQMDGIEAAGILKRRWNMPVIFTTAFDDEETRTRAAATQPLAFLTKPIASESIKELLNRLQLSLS